MNNSSIGEIDVAMTDLVTTAVASIFRPYEEQKVTVDALVYDKSLRK